MWPRRALPKTQMYTTLATESRMKGVLGLQLPKTHASERVGVKPPSPQEQDAAQRRQEELLSEVDRAVAVRAPLERWLAPVGSMAAAGRR